ncbi:uncharacterized protein ARMOST_20485 [Armillaria ostoyae]|uniref:Uncharacterized protein n=1 Tax=Armillaria ostoyae TaxID=47428 RepID=A0A284S7G4_ARMOS|nr:uncharacterized protein ARMOST_20485 [Armillaria ostoyae]
MIEVPGVPTVTVGLYDLPLASLHPPTTRPRRMEMFKALECCRVTEGKTWRGGMISVAKSDSSAPVPFSANQGINLGVDGENLVCGKVGAKTNIALYYRFLNEGVLHGIMISDLGAVSWSRIARFITVAASVENSAQPDIRQTCIDIEYAGGEHILSSTAPSQMAACPECWICPQRDEYRLRAWYDVVGAIVQPSRLSLLAEEWTTSTRE